MVVAVAVAAVAEEEGGDVTIKTRSWEWFEEGVMKTSRLTRKWILLWSLQKDLGLLTPCLQPSETDFRLLTSLPTREHICIVLSHKKCVVICYSSLCKLIQPPFS